MDLSKSIHTKAYLKSFRPAFKLQNWLKALDAILANWNIQPVLLLYFTLSARLTLVILISPEKRKYDSCCKRWINALETELVISPYSPALNEDWAHITQSNDIQSCSLKTFTKKQQKKRKLNFYKFYIKLPYFSQKRLRVCFYHLNIQNVA